MATAQHVPSALPARPTEKLAMTGFGNVTFGHMLTARPRVG
jgi:hypothetical protein